MVPLGFVVTQLKVQITNLAGEPVAYVSQFADLEVTDPLNDSRTGQLTLSLYDRAAAHVRPLSRMIKVAYGSTLVCWGMITRPTFDFDAATVSVPFHDPSLKLKHHFLRYGDFPVDYGYPLDGRGIWVLAEVAVPNENELDRGIPGSGILWGENNTTSWATMPTRMSLLATDPLGQWRRSTRGSNVWDEMISLTEIVGGPEFRLRPVDPEHPGVYDGGRVPPGFYCELDVANRIGVDRRDTLTFDKGFGRNNAENIVREPDGDTVRNHQSVVRPGGEISREDPHRGIHHDEDSMQEYGIYMGWDSSGQDDDELMLENKARAFIGTYSQPLNAVTVTPAMDAPGVPIYGVDFHTGDIIRARAKRGYAEVNELVRITQTTLRQADAASNTRAELTCLPHVEIEVPPMDDGSGGDVIG